MMPQYLINRIESHIDKQFINAQLDPGECYRAGAGAIAGMLLVEIANGKSLEEITQMCETIKASSQQSTYWKK